MHVSAGIITGHTYTHEKNMKLIKMVDMETERKRIKAINTRRNFHLDFKQIITVARAQLESHRDIASCISHLYTVDCIDHSFLPRAYTLYIPRTISKLSFCSHR